MQTLETVAVLLGLFYLLGQSADLIIVNIRKLSVRLGIGVFFLGLILGFLTSLPEMAIGFNAIANNLQEVAFGNLLGGIVVLFGLILGLSIVLNRGIDTDGKLGKLWAVFGFLFLPLVLALDGNISLLEGGALVILYFGLLRYLFIKNKDFTGEVAEVRVSEEQLLKQLFYIMFGIVLVVLFSNAIIRTTTVLLSRFEIPEFILGLLLFSLGTNLPEIIVAIRSWKRQIRDLAMSNLIGSAMGNVLLIGIFSLIKTTQVEIRLAYFTLMVFVAVLFIMFWSFNKSEKRFSKKEGYALISLYTAFILTQVLFQIVS